MSQLLHCVRNQNLQKCRSLVLPIFAWNHACVDVMPGSVPLNPISRVFAVELHPQLPDEINSRPDIQVNRAVFAFYSIKYPG